MRFVRGAGNRTRASLEPSPKRGKPATRAPRTSAESLSATTEVFPARALTRRVWFVLALVASAGSALASMADEPPVDPTQPCREADAPGLPPAVCAHLAWAKQQALACHPGCERKAAQHAADTRDEARSELEARAELAGEARERLLEDGEAVLRGAPDASFEPALPEAAAPQLSLEGLVPEVPQPELPDVPSLAPARSPADGARPAFSVGEAASSGAPPHRAAAREGPTVGLAPASGVFAAARAQAPAAEASVRRAGADVVVPPSLAWPALLAGVLAAALAPLLALYARLSREQVLDHPLRSALLAAVVARPGTTRAELARSHGVHYTTVEWHVRALLRAGLLTAHRNGAVTGLFENHGRYSADERRRALLLADGTNRFLVERRIADPTVRVVDLARELGLTKGAVSKRIAKLRAAGLPGAAPRVHPDKP